MPDNSLTDLLTYRALVLLGEQEHEVGYHAPGDQELDGEDGVNFPDEAAPDALVPKVEASVGLANNYDEPFLFLSYFFQTCSSSGMVTQVSSALAIVRETTL